MKLEICMRGPLVRELNDMYQKVSGPGSISFPSYLVDVLEAIAAENRRLKLRARASTPWHAEGSR